MVNPVTAWVLTKVEHRLESGDWLAQTAYNWRGRKDARRINGKRQWNSDICDIF
jgi:hypothetical protein